MCKPLVVLLVLVALTIAAAGCDSGLPESGPGPGPDGELKTFEGADTALPVQPLKKK